MVTKVIVLLKYCCLENTFVTKIISRAQTNECNKVIQEGKFQGKIKFFIIILPCIN
jgi:hypothetical protein